MVAPFRAREKRGKMRFTRAAFRRRVFHRNGKGSYVKRTIARGFHGRGKDFYKAPVRFEPRRSSANNREKVALIARTMAKVEPRRAGWRQRGRRTATAHAQSYAPIVGRTGS